MACMVVALPYAIQARASDLGPYSILVPPPPTPRSKNLLPHWIVRPQTCLGPYKPRPRRGHLACMVSSRGKTIQTRRETGAHRDRPGELLSHLACMVLALPHTIQAKALACLFPLQPNPDPPLDSFASKCDAASLSIVASMVNGKRGDNLQECSSTKLREKKFDSNARKL